MSKLVVVVPRTRAYCGRLALVGGDGAIRHGPVRVLATASRRVARRHGNEACDPLRPFGHPPAGSYVVAGSLPPGYAHPRRPRRFGGVGALLLAPRDGDALASVASGRRVFALHGGPTDPANRLRPTRGGLRVSDGDLDALLRAVNAAHRDDDTLATVEIVEVDAIDVQEVPSLDLRGARRARGVPAPGRPRPRTRKGAASPALLLLLGLGGSNVGDRIVDRRAMLRAALMLVGGLATSACNHPSPCTPLACDPGDGGPGDDGGGGADARVVADASVAGAGADGGISDAGGDASPHHRDGGRSGAGAAPVPCPPRGYVCAEDDPTYAAAGGGTG